MRLSAIFFSHFTNSYMQLITFNYMSSFNIYTVDNCNFNAIFWKKLCFVILIIIYFIRNKIRQLFNKTLGFTRNYFNDYFFKTDEKKGVITSFSDYFFVLI